MGVFKRRYKNSKGEVVEAKNWSCEFYIDRDRYCKTLEGTSELSKRKAEKLCYELKEAEEENIYGEAQAKVLFEDALMLYYQNYLERINERRSKSHKRIQDRYVYKIETLLSTFGGLSLNEIGRKHFADFIAKRRRDGVSDRTVRDDIGFVQAVYNHAESVGMCEHRDIPNFKSIVKTLRKKQKPIRWLTPTEYLKVIDTINKKTEQRNTFYNRQRKRIVKLAVFSGLRKSEYLSLITSDHICFEQNIIRVTDTKNGKDRVLPMNSIQREVIKEQLQEQLQENIQTKWLFCHPSGKRIFDFDGFHRDCKMAGIEHCRINDLRKTFGTWQLIRGKDIAWVSKYLGHSSIKITQDIYVFLELLLEDEKFVKQLQEQLQELYGEATEKNGK